jgi:DNA-binding IclR family transcriptional regulator
MKISQISENLGITRSTCTAILDTLEQLQWVERGADLAYQPGPGLIPVANAIRARLPIVQRSEPLLRGLLDELDVQTAALSRVDRTHLTLVAKSSRAAGFDAPPSFRLPLFPPFGASVAAFWPPDAQEQWLNQVPDKPTRDHLRRFLVAIRETGVALWRLDQAGQLLQDAVAASDALAPTHGLHRGAASADHQITALALALGRVGFTKEELQPARQPFAVSYIAGTVFNEVDQPCYSLELHTLRHDISYDELGTFVAAVRRSSDQLTEICGGHPDRFLWHGTASGARKVKRAVRK